MNGASCYCSISEIPGKVDLVFLATPPDTIPSLVRECVSLGVKGCVIIQRRFFRERDG